MLCPRCAKHTEPVERRLHLDFYNIRGKIYRLDCHRCALFVAAKLDDKIINIDGTNEEFGNTWKEVTTNEERLCYYILSQIIYPEIDTPKEENFESMYSFADESDSVILRWEGGRSVGFYTMKHKGAEISLTKERYSMHVVDTAYIRSKDRNKGFGLEILLDVVSRFPNEDIGFSKPISTGMLGVLRKFLIRHKEFRLRFWEITDCDVKFSQQLIWFRLRHTILQN